MPNIDELRLSLAYTVRHLERVRDNKRLYRDLERRWSIQEAELVTEAGNLQERIDAIEQQKFVIDNNSPF